MNCKCITEIEEKFKGREFKGREINETKIIQVTFLLGEKMTTCTYSDLEVKLEGLKRPSKTAVLHSYCPFCGTKIEKP